MLEQSKYINLRKKLSIILSLTNFIKQNKNNSLLKKSLVNEVYFYHSLNIHEIEFLIKALETLYHPNEVISLYDDITNIFKQDSSIERINYILHEEYYYKIKCNTLNDMNKELFNSIKDLFTYKNNFEYQLRNIYLYLLENHIKSSKGMTQEYLDYLNNLHNTLKFKYPTNWYKNSTTKIKDYDAENLLNNYLHNNIEKIIKDILKIKDEEFDIDGIYAKVISLQIYLRSLLSMLANEYEMIRYEELYNTLEPNDTIAKRIIRNAFIANYLDTKKMKELSRGEQYEKK